VAFHADAPIDVQRIDTILHNIRCRESRCRLRIPITFKTTVGQGIARVSFRPIADTSRVADLPPRVLAKPALNGISI